MNRYSSDVLAKGWQRANRPTATPIPVEKDMVLEEPTSGFVGAVVAWENGVVVLEDFWEGASAPIQALAALGAYDSVAAINAYSQGNASYDMITFV